MIRVESSRGECLSTLRVAMESGDTACRSRGIETRRVGWAGQLGVDVDRGREGGAFFFSGRLDGRLIFSFLVMISWGQMPLFFLLIPPPSNHCD